MIYSIDVYAILKERAEPGMRASRVHRNLVALVGDFCLFSVGLAFYDPIIVAPAFVRVHRFRVSGWYTGCGREHSLLVSGVLCCV